MIEIVKDLLTEDELSYVNNLIKNESEWKWRTSYDERNGLGERLWFDSIFVDCSKLENYYEIMESNSEYEVVETAINIIRPDRQLENSKHFDSGDLSFATYLNNDFEGGRFFYYNDKDEEFSIAPYAGLSIKIHSKTQHRVEPVTSGVRFSLYSFLQKKQKKNKTLL
jgi:hypothetical protein